jgi:hypothetical protein
MGEPPMSSIMDELKTLQGNRAPAGRLGPSRDEPGREPECPGPTRRVAGPRQHPYTPMLLALSGALVALLALLVAHAAGGPARGAVHPVAVAVERPKESEPVVHVEVAEDTEARIPAAPEHGTRGVWAPLLAGLIERAKEHSDVAADTNSEVVVKPEVRTEGWWARRLAGLIERAKVGTDVAADTDPAVGVELEARTQGWWARRLAGLIERAKQRPDVPIVAADAQLEKPEGESAVAAGSEPPKIVSADPVEATGAEPVEAAPPKPPVRVLTLEEDEANKAAIRGLKVFGVLADERGVGVYTSEGELRAGGRFHEMEVTEVTLRFVLFESGSKRYRWLLPR